ncbi:DNA repair protein RecN [cyanobacterium endosymbiont of Epithemia turgida]|uniref:DNA repair protein RecN n=1 Tax=cyanobacterium endosymbiont of Epithemia turgida TaxID=718217 RepID=UPI0004D1D837|nr:DNA repair protein RecN [cyanobacterium endosymbiont of Epithemia turgida]BAP18388.1 DNA repair protein [cyanobacterium endosymbiont of Epithemia turgida isolate EtSB Lake Yunoko]
MLSLLKIKNFTLVDQLTLKFGQGLNVLTGETGAGKSIILDAIDIVLGGKINHYLIRQGMQQASIEATFEMDNTLQVWLEEQEIKPLEDKTLLCYRELTLTGETMRSRSRINGVVVNLQLMGKLRDRLVEITAQGKPVQLVDSIRQRELLDLYGGMSLLKQRKLVESAYKKWKIADKILKKCRKSEEERLQRLDIVEYELRELEEAKLINPKELEQLNQERDCLSYVGELQRLSYYTYQLLYQNDTGESAIADQLGEAESILTKIAKYGGEIELILEMIRSALTQVVEAGQQINGYGDRLEADPERLIEIEERINLLKRICRKYGPSLEEVINYHQQLQQELGELTDNQQSIEQLEQHTKVARETFYQTCKILTELRQKAAIKLEKQLVEELKSLAMDKVIFVCQITTCLPTVMGSDEVIFYFSPNPGEKIKPLSSTASGGEMSRFLLALKACFAKSEKSSRTLIFDEIDAGVSGKVAQAISEKLHKLSRKYKVLCVTHQPLVAAMADNHFRVTKQMIEEYSKTGNLDNKQLSLPKIRTVVRVTNLDDRQTRREELAQLTVGHSEQEAIEFAQSLLVNAEAYRFKKS